MSHLTPSELEHRRRIADEAALAAAAVHMRHRQPVIRYELKNGNPRDLVTACDIEAEAVARAVIEVAFPGEAIIGEEEGKTKEEQAAILADGGWLIDPLDGTFNFVHGFPDFSATVAFVEAGQPVVGSTYAPMTNELFSAAHGLGASLNGQPTAVSHRRGLATAVVNVSLGRQEEEAVVSRLTRVRRHVFSQRTYGGTALVLAYVASGRFDLFYAVPNGRTGPWDIAAGAVLVREAGGIVSLHDGAPFVLPSSGMAAAADAATLAELRALLAD